MYGEIQTYEKTFSRMSLAISRVIGDKTYRLEGGSGVEFRLNLGVIISLHPCVLAIIVGNLLLHIHPRCAP